ncbi:DNA methyltransferase [Siphonobacter sp. SORGH_AS_0500]|uniref:DNA-methyltransferase n=1 Tax=Siphonobacter sp. SORGH_AS_0500 TaxID=1864824 RepID=UPI00285E67A4|nr:DNA methyltransferase [Siphonobacter sp. SORGH_AS_0500]MDR6197098.1 adenine-specific DNA-methyltransferase [Siphonobacter sp. SORGH_AS_0500]
MKTHLEGREVDFLKLHNALGESISYSCQDNIIAEGDSLELLKRLPDQSVSLILTDPPYHSTKKENITNDTAFKEDSDFLDWLSQYSKEWKRVIRPNGSIYVFCSTAMSARIEILMAKDFNILSHIVWMKPNEPGFEGWKQKMNKQALRQWYAHSERIIFAEPANEGNLKRTWFGNYLKQQRLLCGMSGHELTAITGAHGKVNHGGAVSNWEAGRNIPSRDQYDKICDALVSTGKIESMPLYEDVIRPFSVNSQIEFTDVWDFYSVRPYKGKHPAEKPINMLEHIINSSSYPGDIVLDCFAGSGSTAEAAMRTGRKCILMEIESQWVQAATNRIKVLKQDYTINSIPSSHPSKAKKEKLNKSQISIFA